MKRAIAIVILAGLVCCGRSDETPVTDQILAKVNEVVNIPQLKNLNISNLPVQEVTGALKNKCESNGGATAYDTAKKGIEDFIGCVTPLVNRSEIVKEIEEAKPTGDLDLVFKKYCQKKPVFQKCLTNLMDSVEPCLEEQEKANRKIVQNITDSLLSFVCFKDGDRIALFIAAGGPECFQSKRESIQQCANSTYTSSGFQLPNFANLSSVESLPSLIFDEKACKNMEKMQSCSVKELENCEDPTPANLVDSIYNFIKKVTPCEKLLKEKASEA